MSQKKEDIYVVYSLTGPLHAVKTKRQAEKFVRDWDYMAQMFMAKETPDVVASGVIIYQKLEYKKIKLLYPRELSEKQLKAVKIALDLSAGDSGIRNNFRE